MNQFSPLRRASGRLTFRAADRASQAIGRVLDLDEDVAGKIFTRFDAGRVVAEATRDGTSGRERLAMPACIAVGGRTKVAIASCRTWRCGDEGLAWTSSGDLDKKSHKSAGASETRGKRRSRTVSASGAPHPCARRFTLELLQISQKREFAFVEELQARLADIEQKLAASGAGSSGVR